MRTVLAVCCASFATVAVADIQLLSNTATVLVEAHGGGGSTTVIIGPITEVGIGSLNNFTSLNEATGSVIAKTGTGQFAGVGSGLGRASVASLIDPVVATLMTSVEAEGRISASGSLGMGLGRAESEHVISFTATADTPYTLNAELFSITPGYAPTDVVRITQNGSSIHLIDEANPADIVGFTGTFMAGATYEIRIDLREFVAGPAGTSPIQQRSSAEVDIAFEAGTTILPPPDLCPADINGDGDVNPADFTAWLTCFNNPMSAPFCENADLNNNGTIEPADFTAWLAAFNAGCD